MKTSKHFPVVGLMLLLLTSVSTDLIAQDSQTKPKKKITITTETTDEKGVKTTRKITRVGEAAEDIDYNELLKNELSGDDVEVTISEETPAENSFFKMPKEGQAFLFKHKQDDKGFLGVYTNVEDGNLKINQIIEGGGAEKAGLLAGDFIVSIDNVAVNDYNSLVKQITAHKPGDVVKVKYSRDGKEAVADVTLGTRKAEMNFNTFNECAPLKNECNLFQDTEKRAKLGVNIEDAADDKGVRVTEVVENSAAQSAGLQAGDVITQVDKEAVHNTDELIQAVQNHKPGDEVNISFLRKGEPKSAKATLKEDAQIHRFYFNTNPSSERKINIRKETETEPDLQAQAVPPADNQLTPEEIELFPNPSDGVVTVKFKLSAQGAVTVTILDINGKELYRDEVKDFNGSYSHDFDLSRQAQGTYLLSIQQGDKVMSEKILRK